MYRLVLKKSRLQIGFENRNCNLCGWQKSIAFHIYILKVTQKNVLSLPCPFENLLKQTLFSMAKLLCEETIIISVPQWNISLHCAFVMNTMMSNKLFSST